MDEEAVFQRYDVRGKYPEELDEEFVERMGKAVGTFASRNYAGKVVVCRDNKQSSEGLKQALVSGVKATGSEVLDVGEGPTDYTALSAKERNAVGVQVTSSHLPLDRNGLKFIYPEGNSFVNEDLERLKQLFREKDFEDGQGSVEKVLEMRQFYREELEKYFKQFSDSIEKKVVLETMGGAGSIFLPDILEQLGAEVVDLSEGNETPRIDPPNPKPENLRHVEEKVEEEDADIGIATDMDADRVAIYYGGEWLDGNEIFAILAEIVEPERIVASIDTSELLEENTDAEIFYTRVGDPFVLEETLERDAELSGEPNKHYCFKSFVPYNSGSLGGALLTAAEIGQIRQNFSKYYSRRESVEVEDKEQKMGQITARVRESFEVISEIDGVKFKVGDANVLIRSSGSSEKIRVITESRDEEEAREALEKGVEIVRNA